jgi:hypothetical protein
MSPSEHLAEVRVALSHTIDHVPPAFHPLSGGELTFQSLMVRDELQHPIAESDRLRRKLFPGPRLLLERSNVLSARERVGFLCGNFRHASKNHRKSKKHQQEKSAEKKSEKEVFSERVEFFLSLNRPGELPVVFQVNKQAGFVLVKHFFTLFLFGFLGKKFHNFFSARVSSLMGHWTSQNDHRGSSGRHG